MQITSLFHVSIKTQKPQATKQFYIDVLCLREAPRPPFEFPGFWMEMATSYGGVPLHFYSGAAALNSDGSKPEGTGVVDHIAFSAHGFEDMRERCKSFGVPYRERAVPALTLVQLFLYDPNGVQIELNFNSASEVPPPKLDAKNFPPAGAHWFEPAQYARWGSD